MSRITAVLPPIWIIAPWDFDARHVADVCHVKSAVGEVQMNSISNETAGDDIDDAEWGTFEMSADHYERRMRVWLEFDRGDCGIAVSLWLTLAGIAFLLL